MAKFRKKPVVIDAVQVRADNLQEVYDFIVTHNGPFHTEPDGLVIETLEGNMKANLGDYVIRGVKGEFYPCKPDIFEASYEAVVE